MLHCCHNQGYIGARETCRALGNAFVARQWYGGYMLFDVRVRLVHSVSEMICLE